jgi:hypothetical protein
MSRISLRRIHHDRNMMVAVIIAWFRKIACWMIGADDELGAHLASHFL